MTLWAKRTDANHAEIRQAMRDTGSEVEDMSGAGGGFPDTIVYTPDKRLLLVEIKTPTGKLTAPQVKFHARFPVHLVRSVTEAVNLIHPPGPDDGTFSSRPNAEVFHGDRQRQPDANQTNKQPKTKQHGGSPLG